MTCLQLHRSNCSDNVQYIYGTFLFEREIQGQSTKMLPLKLLMLTNYIKKIFRSGIFVNIVIIKILNIVDNN